MFDEQHIRGADEALHLMNLLDQLLGPASPCEDPHVRHLVLDNDVRVFIEDSVRDEDVTIGSWPGRMPQDDWLASLTQPWMICGKSPLHADASEAVSVEPGTGLTLLLSMWPRAALTQQALAEALEMRLHAHRLWSSRLAPLDPSSN